MNVKNTLWARLGHWMSPFNTDQAVPDLAQPEPPPAQQAPDIAKANGRPARLPWRRREATLQHLQQGHDHVLEVLESMESTLAAQSTRSAKMASVLERLTHGMEGLPAVTRQQTETLTEVVEHVKTATNRHQGVIDSLMTLPQSVDQQHQVMRSVATQVQTSATATQRLHQRLDELAGSSRSLGQALQEQLDSVKTIQTSTRDHQERMETLLRKQTRRVTTILAGGTVVVLAAVLFRMIS